MPTLATGVLPIAKCPVDNIVRELRDLAMRPRTTDLVLNLQRTGTDQMSRRMYRKAMIDRIVGSADAAPESSVCRPTSPRVPKLLRVPEKSVGVNHHMTVWGDRLG